MSSVLLNELKHRYYDKVLNNNEDIAFIPLIMFIDTIYNDHGTFEDDVYSTKHKNEYHEFKQSNNEINEYIKKKWVDPIEIMKKRVDPYLNNDIFDPYRETIDKFLNNISYEQIIKVVNFELKHHDNEYLEQSEDEFKERILQFGKKLKNYFKLFAKYNDGLDNNIIEQNYNLIDEIKEIDLYKSKDEIVDKITREHRNAGSVEKENEIIADYNKQLTTIKEKGDKLDEEYEKIKSDVGTLQDLYNNLKHGDGDGIDIVKGYLPNEITFINDLIDNLQEVSKKMKNTIDDIKKNYTDVNNIIKYIENTGLSYMNNIQKLRVTFTKMLTSMLIEDIDNKTENISRFIRAYWGSLDKNENEYYEETYRTELFKGIITPEVNRLLSPSSIIYVEILKALDNLEKDTVPKELGVGQETQGAPILNNVVNFNRINKSMLDTFEIRKIIRDNVFSKYIGGEYVKNSKFIDVDYQYDKIKVKILNNKNMDEMVYVDPWILNPDEHVEPDERSLIKLSRAYGYHSIGWFDKSSKEILSSKLISGMDYAYSKVREICRKSGIEDSKIPTLNKILESHGTLFNTFCSYAAFSSIVTNSLNNNIPVAHQTVFHNGNKMFNKEHELRNALRYMEGFNLTNVNSRSHFDFFRKYGIKYVN